MNAPMSRDAEGPVDTMGTRKECHREAGTSGGVAAPTVDRNRMQDGTAGRRTPATPRVDYHAYIGSDEWKAKRKIAFERSALRAKMHSPACEVCGRYGLRHKNRAEGRDYYFRVENTNGLQVHHVHYRTLGHETPNDLIVLCTDRLYLELDVWERVGCHERAHDDRAYRSHVAQIAESRP